MIRLSSSMLASSLLLTNVESHKREPSSERFLPDSGAAHSIRAHQQGKEMEYADPYTML
jgi:hypothetical protein